MERDRKEIFWRELNMGDRHLTEPILVRLRETAADALDAEVL